VSETLVVGGHGFVGSAIHAQIDSRLDEYVFVSRHDRMHPDDHRRRIQIDLLDSTQVAGVSGFDRAIWVAGGADHSLGRLNPIQDLELQVVALLRFLEHFRGSLTLLSSQATYFGLTGAVAEAVDHVPTMPYGFAKLAAERYAHWALDDGRLRQLWIHRLMYAYGPNERPRRLLARCVRASLDGGRVVVTGGGQSFLNPLPVEFIADVLLRSDDQMKSESDGFHELTNLNHPEPWSVLDVLKAFKDLCDFDFDVFDEGEEWPVTFHGDVDALSRWLGMWGLGFQPVQSGLAAYADRVATEMPRS
jgi:nucleoside-diphosphate-sugar epimerase